MTGAASTKAVNAPHDVQGPFPQGQWLHEQNVHGLRDLWFLRLDFAEGHVKFTFGSIAGIDIYVASRMRAAGERELTQIASHLPRALGRGIRQHDADARRP